MAYLYTPVTQLTRRPCEQASIGLLIIVPHPLFCAIYRYIGLTDSLGTWYMYVHTIPMSCSPAVLPLRVIAINVCMACLPCALANNHG